MLPEQLSFSTCQFGKEYTCDSGQCISMSKRCDKIFDCFDKSDEDLCEIVKLPCCDGKGGSLSVNKEPAWEMEITAKYIIEKVNFIDIMNTKIGVTSSIQMTWKDKRLLYKKLILITND